MQIYRIHVRNDAFQLWETLKSNRNKRHKAGLFFVEGVRNINGALRYGWQIEAFAYNADAALSGWAKDALEAAPQADRYLLSGPLMAALSDREEHPSELICLVRMRSDDPDALTLGPSPLLAVFDRPSNKGNLGTVIRTCDALGVDALLLTGHAVDLYDPEVVLATVGSLFSTPVLRLEAEAFDRYWDALRGRYPTLRAVGTSAHAHAPLWEVDLTGPTLLLIGNEQTGLAKNFRERVDVMTTIPMAGTSYASSFNAACAATVLLYEAVRQRKGGR